MLYVYKKIKNQEETKANEINNNNNNIIKKNAN